MIEETILYMYFIKNVHIYKLQWVNLSLLCHGEKALLSS